jgi:hypothetical protein
MPMGKVMEKYGWGQDWIRKACAAYGVSTRNKGMKGNLNRVMEILGRIRKGDDIDDLAVEYCLSKVWIYRIRTLGFKYEVLDKKEVEKNFEKADLVRAEAKWRRENPLRNG